MRYYPKAFLVAFAMCCVVSAESPPRPATDPEPRTKPNIVFILCDDLGYGDLGITGHPYAKSPNIDRLAKEGIRFNEAYMSAAWCAPSRAALMTGIYPARYFNKTRQISVRRPSLTGELKKAGYTTAHFGKWHISPKTGGNKPEKYGIDECLITNGTGPTWPDEVRKKQYYRANLTKEYVDLAIDFMTRNQEKNRFSSTSGSTQRTPT